MPRFAANLSFLFTELPWERRFDAAAAAGFPAVEINTPGPYMFSEAEFARRVRDAGVECVALLAPGRPGEEMGVAALPDRSAAFRESMEKAVAYGAAAGAAIIHPLAGLVPSGEATPALRRNYVERIRLAAGMAGSAGIAIGIEPVCSFRFPEYFLKTTAQAAAIIDDVGLPNVGIIYDVFHAQMEEGHVAATLRATLAKIGHMQIGNAPDRHEPGCGEIDFPYLFRLADTLGYDGWWACEYNPSTTTLDSLGWAAPWGIGKPE